MGKENPMPLNRFLPFLLLIIAAAAVSVFLASALMGDTPLWTLLPITAGAALVVRWIVRRDQS
ncbi:hypothetical protein CLV78_10950 [Aliiruegeria haliotis]|uniref:Uncharacterized protein n=2 Tax=Aliiruegeria haliotis TaxID=1280846 RepID=A0A2T0RJZ2_9RHOB|nr:hypothetical protein CLV78_10950 [Aliiruegeria haliotis]